MEKRSVVKMMFDRFFAHSVSHVGGQLAFFMLMSLFPFLIFVNALIGSLNISIDQLEMVIAPLFPQQIIDLIIGYIVQVSENQSIGLLSIAVVVVIFSASKSVRSLAFSINTAYGLSEKKHVVREVLYSMLFVVAAGITTVMITLFIALSGGFLTEIMKITNISYSYITLFNICRWVVLITVLFIILAIMYKITPDKKVKFKHTIQGTIFATLGMIALTYGFSAYVNYFVVGSVFNGTIGAVILLMLWAYFASEIIILGAELNSCVEELSNKAK